MHALVAGRLGDLGDQLEIEGDREAARARDLREQAVVEALAVADASAVG